jgi:hypothetical protein
MTPRPRSHNPKGTILTLRVHDDTAAQLREVQARDGVPISEQVRRGIAMWLDSRGVVKSERKRAATRKRS